MHLAQCDRIGLTLDNEPLRRHLGRYAAADSADIDNSRAKVILTGGDPLVTTDHVLVETWTLLRFRIDRHAAEKFWNGLRSGTAVVEPVGTADLEARGKLGPRTAIKIVLWSIERALQ